jgi:2',3'-cyclic-nucleotide 2'-phosphodiesterase (5'-nucleotidase family)
MSRKFFKVLLILVMVTSFPALRCAQSDKTLTILHTNDTHSCMLPFGPNEEFGGIARMSTLLKRLKAKDENVLMLNAGDVFVGTFEFNKYLGYPELKIMQGLYDAMCLGNHEFDLGLDVLVGVLSGQLASDTAINLPVLCANINLSGNAALKSFVKSYIIKDIGGVKVGITGVVNADKQNYSESVNKILRDPYQTAGVMAGTLRALGCEVVVCISHLGKMADVMGLSQVPGIDIIVGGHSHDALTKAIVANGKIIVQAGEFGRYLGELKVKVKKNSVELSSYKLHPVTDKIKSDPTLAPTLNALKKGIEQDPRFGLVYTKKVAEATRDLVSHWQGGSPYRDTAIGNLVADAIKRELVKAGYHVDIALEAQGYTAAKIYKGKVVGNDIMRIVPYGYDPTSGLGFKMDCVLISGAQLLAGLEYSVSLVEYTEDLCMQASGLTYRYDSRRKAPSRIGEINRIDMVSVKINGQHVEPNALYWVALSEQLYGFLKSLGLVPFKVIETKLFEYNLVRDYMKRVGHIDYASEGRIIDVSYIH